VKTGDHDAARRDIVMLLTKLRDREDVTYRTRTDVDAILASIDADAHLERGSTQSGFRATAPASRPVRISLAASQLSDYSADRQRTPATGPRVVAHAAAAQQLDKAITPERRALHRLTIRSQPLHRQANQSALQ
jgi:hypothetical protein